MKLPEKQEKHPKDCNCILCWDKAIKSIKFKSKEVKSSGVSELLDGLEEFECSLSGVCKERKAQKKCSPSCGNIRILKSDVERRVTELLEQKDKRIVALRRVIQSIKNDNKFLLEAKREELKTKRRHLFALSLEKQGKEVWVYEEKDVNKVLSQSQEGGK